MISEKRETDTNILESKRVSFPPEHFRILDYRFFYFI